MSPDPLVNSEPAVVTPEQAYDVIVAGFGPAALAIAIALRDIVDESKDGFIGGLKREPNIAYLERQSSFEWHPGMLIEGAKMQISFIKDMATLRNPRSNFTFLNYLHQKKRIVQFANLSTFLPTRTEFNDYLQWCAGHFEKDVFYSEDVLRITPDIQNDVSEKSIDHFLVHSRDRISNVEHIRRTRHVIIATGGKPEIPRPLLLDHPRVIHSSQYLKLVHTLLPDISSGYKIAVIGSGQSAAEIFDDLHALYPNCHTNIIFREDALRPSDDSPFVNEVFDPDRISEFFEAPAHNRKMDNAKHRSTNYGVVRIELLEKIYEKMYIERVHHGNNEEMWQHRVFPRTTIASASAHDNKVLLVMETKDIKGSRTFIERRYDLVIAATGYKHDGHMDLLRPMIEQSQLGNWSVGKDYKLNIPSLPLSQDTGIWVQGCNEETHGLSDTLLSALAVRAGQVVANIFDY
jgi:L-ornithine N5-monooxygenase